MEASGPIYFDTQVLLLFPLDDTCRCFEALCFDFDKKMHVVCNNMYCNSNERATPMRPWITGAFVTQSNTCCEM